MPAFKLICGYTPGAIGRIAELHASYYHRNWGFGLFFEAKVATELSDFLRRFDENRDGFWTVSANGRVEGAIAIDGQHVDDQGAHLRWFIVSDALRGRGAGHLLLQAAIDFCQCQAYGRIYLWTFEGLQAARHLYDKWGFQQIENHHGTQWGIEVNEQRLECLLPMKA